MRWRDNREKRWDWTRRDDRKRGMRWRRDNRELTAEEREGWEEGIISHRGSVQWGSIIHCICATCSDQCDDRNLREEKWSERSVNSQQLLQTHATEAAVRQHQRLTAINEACSSVVQNRRGTKVQRGSGSMRWWNLHRLECEIFPMTFERVNWNKSSSMWASPKHVAIFKVSIITIWTTICNYVTSFTSKACSDLWDGVGEGESPAHHFIP